MLGLTCPRLSCQFGTICTDPAAPHAEQTRRKADARPGLILREYVEPHVRPAIATAVQALDVAGHMAVSQPFRRAAGRIVSRPFRVPRSAHAASKAAS